MKLSSCFSLFPNLPLMGGALLLALCLCSCGDKEAGVAEAGKSERLSPVESYEELLSLRLKEVEQMTDLVVSIQDRTAGEALMN